MAMVLAAVGTAVAWVGTTAAAISASASFYLASVTGMSWVAAGTVVSAVSQLALSAATTALMTPSVGRGGSPVAFKADPSAPISGVMGRFGVGGRQLHANVWGKDNLFLSFAVALSLGPIQSVEEFTASGTVVTFPGAQGLAAATEPYINKMWQTYRLGLPTDAYLSPPTGVSDGTPTMSEWTSAHTLPGFAQTFWTMKNNSKREGYQSGVPAPLWTLLGMKVWDPRLDSTYPGGSGSQRRTDWSTWTYSANPYLHALAWVRGHHKLAAGGTIDLTKRVAGVGAPDAAIDIAAFVEGANVADANSWAISGEWTTADDKWQTLAAMLQAGGGVPISQGAQISCMVETPRTSLMTVTGADIVGSVSLNVMASRRDRPNTVIPRVRLEAHKFEEVALGAVTSSTYVTEDGGESRVIETAYRFVGLAKQGAELAGYGLANTRETLKASIPCKPHLLGLRAGDAFTATEPELGLSGQKFVVLKRTFDPASAVVTLDVRSETDAKHAWALGRSADAPASPSLTAPDPVPTTPDTADWTIAARPAESSGVQQPGLIVTGPTVNENIGAVLVEYGASESGPWQQAYSGPPTIATVAIDGLVGGDAYYVGITYWSVRGVPSAQLVKGPYTAPGLTAGDVVVIGGRPVEDLVQDWRELPALIRERELAAENTLRETLDRHSRIQAEEQARIAALMAEAEARGTAIAGVETLVDVVATDLAAEVTTREEQYAATSDTVSLHTTLIENNASDIAAATSDLTTLTSSVNVRNRTFRQTTAPANPTGGYALTTGDLWADSDDNNQLYRWSGTAWVLSHDVRGEDALAEITAARNGSANLNAQLTAMRQTTTDGLALRATTTQLDTLTSSVNVRNRTFLQTTAPANPTGGYALVAGDLWADSDDSNQLHRWSGSAWVEAHDVRGEDALAEITAARNGSANLNAQLTAMRTTVADGLALRATTTELSTLTSSVNVRNRTFLQTTAPTNPAGGYALVAGDLWADSDDNNQLYRWSGSAWVASHDVRGEDALAEITAARNGSASLSAELTTMRTTVADGLALRATTSELSTLTSSVNVRNRSFLQTTAPSGSPGGYPLIAGDLWADSDDNNELYRWSGSAWVASGDLRGETALAEITAARNGSANLNAQLTTMRSTVTDGLAGKASAASVTALEVTIDTPTTGVSARLVEAASVAADALGTAEAIYGVTLDVNGNISGFSSVNDGATSTFDVKADVFRLSNGATNLTPFSVDTVAGKIDMNADVRINGSLAVSGSFQTAALAGDSISKEWRYDSFSITDFTGHGAMTTRTTMFSMTLTATGKKITFDGKYLLRGRHSQDDWHLFVVVERLGVSGGTIDVFDSERVCLAISGDGYITDWQHISFTDTPPAGSVSYRVAAYHTFSIGSPGGFVTYDVSNKIMSAREHKTET